MRKGGKLVANMFAPDCIRMAKPCSNADLVFPKGGQEFSANQSEVFRLLSQSEASVESGGEGADGGQTVKCTQKRAESLGVKIALVIGATT